jgi:hypothetical protein
MLQLGIRGLGIARFKFNVLAWFAKNEPGAWYDPSDLTTLFQESTGVTPMATVGTVADQPVGLMLDKSRGLALGTELVTGDSSTFTSGVGNWAGTSATIAAVNGELQITQTVTNGRAYLSFPCVAGAYYLVSADVRSVNGVSCGLGVSQYGDGNGANFAAGLTTSSTFVRQTIRLPSASGTALYTITVGCNGAGTGVFACDNISVKQIAGNHAYQATSANRPILSARVNLLTKTEDFSAAVWEKPDGALSITGGVSDPLGGVTAFTLTTSAVNQRFSQLSGLSNISASVWIRRRTGSGAIGLFNGTAWPALAITSEWKLFSVSGGSLFSLYLSASGDAFDVWHPDLRPTNSGALLPPYQRVNTASDYDSVGFPLYLKCNGLQSAMSTNSIDFTATDKMTVVTGVRKLSDSFENGRVFELSAAINDGVIGLRAPGVSISKGYMIVSRGTSTNIVDIINYVAPITNILTLQSSISTPSNLVRIDGLLAGSNLETQGTGTFGNYPLYLFSRNNGTVGTYFNGQFYGAVIRGAQSDTASVAQTEQYMAQKTGITF